MGKPYADRIRTVIDEQRSLGFIRPSNSPWATPCLLVPKKNGKDRMVVDYRELNKVTKKDAYPLPRLDELLDFLGKAAWFSSVDCMQGYYQVPMEESSIPKTAFVTPHGLYEYTVMAQGLCGSPSTYQRLMDQVLRDHIGIRCFVYLDDIIIFSPTLEQHMEDI